MGGRIFICYRHTDEPGYAMAVFCQLQNLFLSDRLSMDFEGRIKPEADLAKAIEDKVENSDVMLVIIGPGWLGQRSLYDENDFVRIEIEAALRLGKQIIPVLVNNGKMPQSADLPAALKPLARRQAVELAHERFPADAKALCDAIVQAIGETVDLLGEINSWEAIKESRDIQKIKDHLEQFPNGMTANIIERLAKGRDAGPAPLIEAVKSFSENQTVSEKAEPAKARTADINAVIQLAAPREVDDSAWSQALRQGASGVRRYLEHWPRGYHRDEARSWLRRRSLVLKLPPVFLFIVAIIFFLKYDVPVYVYMAIDNALPAYETSIDTDTTASVLLFFVGVFSYFLLFLWMIWGLFAYLKDQK